MLPDFLYCIGSGQKYGNLDLVYLMVHPAHSNSFGLKPLVPPIEQSIFMGAHPGLCILCCYQVNLEYRLHLSSGSLVECLTRDREAACSSLTSIAALWSLSKTHLS